jgi:thiamine-phosphate pyrophosphorylase
VSHLNNSSHRAIFCYVTDRRSLSANKSSNPQAALLSKVAEAAAAGVTWIQIREKDLSGKDCGSLTREALRLAAKSSPSKSARTRILVNDRLDVALSESAGGVHLGEKSLPLTEARRLAGSRARGSDFLVGVSCHSLGAAQTAADSGADYLFFGPVFATPSKAPFGAPQGIERLAEVCRAVSIPVLAIGGITPANTSSCLAAGASGIAAIRLFQDAADISALIDLLGKLAR